VKKIQVSKKKVSVKLMPGQSVLVLDYDSLMHLASTCDFLAIEQENQQDAEAWRYIADEIRFQANENLYSQNQEYSEEW
jgi:hypothetical protein